MKAFDVFVGFVVGAAVGSAASFIFLNKKYAKKYEEDFEKLKEEISNPKVIDFFQKQKQNEEEEIVDDDIPKLEKKEIKHRKPGEKGYIDYTSFYRKGERVEEQPEEPESEDEDLIINDLSGDPDAIPEIISPDEFGDEETYAKISLLYTTDGVLMDDEDEIFDGAVDCLPKDFDKHFGEYDDSAVYVKNDRIRVYYEILKSLKTSKEILRIKKHYDQVESIMVDDE